MLRTPSMLNAALHDYFPDEDYRFHLRVGQMAPAEFFHRTPEHESLMAQRRALLAMEDPRYAGCLPEGDDLLNEALEMAGSWGASIAVGGDRCRGLGMTWEEDFLLLKPDAAGEFRLLGGCVCFPSSWAFEEKLGRPLGWIHEAVPGLNTALARPIDNFLRKLRPGVAFTRWNWGLSRWSHLNQHPSLNLSKLTEPLRADEVWLRLEDQALIALPRSGGVLFGIRIWVRSLTEVRSDAEAARRLHRAIATMPDALAQYKNLAAARAELLRLLAP